MNKCRVQNGNIISILKEPTVIVRDCRFPSQSGRVNSEISISAGQTHRSLIRPQFPTRTKAPTPVPFAHAAHCAEQPLPLPGTYLLAGRRREIAARVTQSCRRSFLLPSAKPASSTPRSSGTSEPVTQLPGRSVVPTRGAARGNVSQTGFPSPNKTFEIRTIQVECADTLAFPLSVRLDKTVSTGNATSC